jgi:DNA-binding transcriptional MerR regulator
MAKNPQAMTIGDLAKIVGKTPRALRLYEEMGLIEPRGRTCGGFRTYGPEAVTRLNWVQCLVDAGLPLTEIRELLHAFEHAETRGDAMGEVQAFYSTQIERVEERIRRLAALKTALVEARTHLERCGGCTRTGLPEICTGCDRNQETWPAMAAGLLAEPKRDE